MGFNNPGRVTAVPPKAPIKGKRVYGAALAENIGSSASMLTIQEGLLAEAVDAVTLAGDMVSFSRTTDGGAWCIYVKCGADAYRLYPHNAAELTEVLRDLARVAG